MCTITTVRHSAKTHCETKPEAHPSPARKPAEPQSGETKVNEYTELFHKQQEASLDDAQLTFGKQIVSGHVNAWSTARSSEVAAGMTSVQMGEKMDDSQEQDDASQANDYARVVTSL